MADARALYRWQPSFLLGFHGTDQSVVESVVGAPACGLSKSESKTEWLSHGVYFWENDPARAQCCTSKRGRRIRRAGPGQTRNWTQVDAVTLNPERDSVVKSTVDGTNIQATAARFRR